MPHGGTNPHESDRQYDPHHGRRLGHWPRPCEEFHKLGNQVIIAGRRKQALDETTAANPGMKSLVLDIEDPAAVRAFAARAVAEFPALNVLINNAGIMRVENLLEQQADLADAEAIVSTNLLGPIRLTAALLPHLQTQTARPSSTSPPDWLLFPSR